MFSLLHCLLNDKISLKNFNKPTLTFTPTLAILSNSPFSYSKRWISFSIQLNLNSVCCRNSHEIRSCGQNAIFWPPSHDFRSLKFFELQLRDFMRINFKNFKIFLIITRVNFLLGNYTSKIFTRSRILKIFWKMKNSKKCHENFYFINHRNTAGFHAN